MFIHFGRILTAAISLIWGSFRPSAQPEAKAQTYGEAKEYLSRHTTVIELSNKDGVRVAICPAWQGRVMTSTCSGPDGPSFGFVHREYIDAAKRICISTIMAAKTVFGYRRKAARSACGSRLGQSRRSILGSRRRQSMRRRSKWRRVANASKCRLAQRMKLRNAAATEFDLAVTREIRVSEPGRSGRCARRGDSEYPQATGRQNSRL